MADDDMMQLTKVFLANLMYHYLSARMMFEVFAPFVQKGLMFPDQVQLLMKTQGYRKFFLRKRWNNYKELKQED